MVQLLRNSLVVPQKDIRRPNNSIYVKELKTGIQLKTCTGMFVVALFSRSKRWKQPICPLTDEEVLLDVVYPHNGTLSAITRNEGLTHVTMWMDTVYKYHAK